VLALLKWKSLLCIFAYPVLDGDTPIFSQYLIFYVMFYTLDMLSSCYPLVSSLQLLVYDVSKIANSTTPDRTLRSSRIAYTDCL